MQNYPRRKGAVKYSASFIITLSQALGQKLWVLLFNFYWLVQNLVFNSTKGEILLSIIGDSFESSLNTAK